MSGTGQDAGVTTPALLRRSSREGRLTLAALTLGSGISILDGTVVNVALKTLGEDLDADLSVLQWVVNGYTLALASLVLVGGAIGDRLGRRRVYLGGMVLFAVGSALCALSANAGQLVAFRIVQGIGAALATPGALAIIQASYVREDRAPAIGTWAGLSGVAAAIGPFVGGWLLEYAGWPWIFWVNVPLCVLVVIVCLRYTPESRNPSAARGFDVVGAVLSVVVLAALTYALTTASVGTTPAVWAGAAISVLAGAAFLWRERVAEHPLLPLGLFRDRVFTAANLMTFLVYGAFSGALFVLAIQLQVGVGWSPLEAGLATLPITIALMLLSSRAGALAARIGPRIPMSLGPVLCAVGFLLLAPVAAGTGYWTGVFPGVTVFALGLALLVAPLTSTVLAAAPDEVSGTASGINNAVARAGSLLAVAVLPVLVGLSGRDYADPSAMTSAHRASMLLCAAALTIGGLVSWFGLARAPRPSPPG